MSNFSARINKLKVASANRVESVTLQRAYFDISAIFLTYATSFTSDLKTKTKIPFLIQILKMLKTQGYIRFFSIKVNGRSVSVTVYLKYSSQGDSALRNISIISVPSRAVYAGNQSFWQPLSTSGTLILSTPQGILTDKEARSVSVGGKMLVAIP